MLKELFSSLYSLRTDASLFNERYDFQFGVLFYYIMFITKTNTHFKIETQEVTFIYFLSCFLSLIKFLL